MIRTLRWRKRCLLRFLWLKNLLLESNASLSLKFSYIYMYYYQYVKRNNNESLLATWLLHRTRILMFLNTLRTTVSRCNMYIYIYMILERARAHGTCHGMEEWTRRALATSRDALSRLNEEDGTTGGNDIETPRLRGRAPPPAASRRLLGFRLLRVRWVKKPGKWQSRGTW